MKKDRRLAGGVLIKMYKKSAPDIKFIKTWINAHYEVTT